ncbi:nucleotidyltransferase [Planctomycetota bacterium]
MLSCLLEEKVEFLLVGGYALGVYGHPRATKDIDLWIWADSVNSEKTYRALAKFGAPLANVTPTDFSKSGVILQIGVPPNRIDLITKADGIEFKASYQNRAIVSVEGLDIPVISKKDLILNKRATDRPQDRVDVDILEAK